MGERIEIGGEKAAPFSESLYYRIFLTLITGFFFLMLCSMALAPFSLPAAGLLKLLLACALTGGLLFLRRRAGLQRFDSIPLALACTCSLQFFLPAGRSLLWLLLFGLLFDLLRRTLPLPVSRRITRAAVWLGLLYALAIFLGWQLMEFGRIELLHPEGHKDHELLRLWLRFFCLAFFFTVVLNAVLNHLCRRCAALKPLPAGKSGFRLWLLGTGCMFLAWLPYYLVFYPGCLTPDSFHELSMQLGQLPLSNHHPMIHQMFIRLCLLLGGNPQRGVGLYSLLQMLLLAGAFSLGLTELARRGVPRGVLFALLAFLALFTIHAFYSITMWKDVLFGASALVLMILLLRECEGSRSPARAAALVLVSFLFCTLRNNGWYAFLLGYPCFLLINRRFGKRLLAIGLAVVVLVSGYHSLMFRGLGVQKSSSGEALSVPLQQIARVVKVEGYDETDPDLAVLSELFTEIRDLGELYNPLCSDDVKQPRIFDSAAFSREPGRYLRAWAGLGLRHPAVYVDAFLHQCFGYWYPDVNYWTIQADGYRVDLGVERNTRFAALQEKLTSLHNALALERPISILYSTALPVWLLIFSAVLLGLKRRGRLASPLLLLAGVWLTTLASPVFCEYRYLYSLPCCAPLFLLLALCLPKAEAPKET